MSHSPDSVSCDTVHLAEGFGTETVDATEPSYQPVYSSLAPISQIEGSQPPQAFVSGTETLFLENDGKTGDLIVITCSATSWLPTWTTGKRAAVRKKIAPEGAEAYLSDAGGLVTSPPRVIGEINRPISAR